MGFAQILLILLTFSALFLVFGCTKEEEAEFNKALMQGVADEAKNTLTGKGSGIGISIGDDAPKGECRFDSDCSPICAGAVLWKRGCDARENKCVKTFDTNCAEKSTDADGTPVPFICTQGVCAEDYPAINIARREALVKKGNGLTAAMSATNSQWQVANDLCLTAAANMMATFSTSTSRRVSVPDSAAKYFSNQGKVFMKQYDYAFSSKTEMESGDYVSINCQAADVLANEVNYLDSERSRVVYSIRVMDGVSPG